tara:strand:+ start:14087 stop:14440 length:354 start_codon:yes stop_codon:yes gene_type:complete
MASHRIAGRRLSRKKDQRKALLRSQAVSLITNERIKTTLPKAKETRIVTEKLITYGKKGGLHNRRLAIKKCPNSSVIDKVFDTLAERYNDRAGGYTRITKLGPRQGDGAEMAIIELV